MFKTSNLLFIVTIIILILSFITYRLLKENLYDNHNYSQKIVFNSIQRETNTLLNKLLFKYSQEKEKILNKHKVVLDYLKEKPYNTSLKQIHSIINKNLENKPYNIYITNENLIIKNTTFKADLGFDLSFAKKLFDKHKKQNIIGVSAPIFETYSTKFLSFTDSYLPIGKNRILQISYKYNNVENELKNIQNLIDSNKNISNSTAYIIFEDGYIGDFIFKSFKSYKTTLEKINRRINNGKKLLQKLNDNSFITTTYFEDDIKYKLYYFLGKSPLFDDAKIIYSVIFDESKFEKKLFYLNLIFSLITLLFISIVFIVFKIKRKEQLLNYKDKFIEHSVHEIKTPLSIIKLNNQLREKKLGKDKYSQKIEAAVKTLQVSYEDMTFLHTKNKIIYDVEKLDLAFHLKHRINFFESIVKSQEKKIVLNVKNDLFIKMSKVELDRLIDNNLSNAIKYSSISSQIEIVLENSSLSFISKGDNIKDINKIFLKYTRENTIKGGHGLGLSIVKNICEKYNILIDVKSSNNTNLFKYIFK